jgi:hypothetical protein
LVKPGVAFYRILGKRPPFPTRREGYPSVKRQGMNMIAA